MRVIAGQFRGRRLHSPKGRLVRPTLDRARETLFAILSHRVLDARFLDLYAGTGSVALEALSRGAKYACMVELRRTVADVLRRNIADCGVEEQTRVLVASLPGALYRLRDEEPFDIVFLDPPYDAPLALPTLQTIDSVPHLIADEGVVILQHDDAKPWSQGTATLECFCDRSAGRTRFAFLRKRATSDRRPSW